LTNYSGNSVCASGATIYSCNFSGVDKSIDGETSFTQVHPIGCNRIAVSGTNVYSATSGGFYISTNSGGIFNAKAGLGTAIFWDVFASGTNVAIASAAGVHVSSDSGNNFANYNTANGLAANSANGVFMLGNVTYAADFGSSTFSVSPSLGANFITAATGLTARKIHIDSGYVYVATDEGLAILAP